MKEALFDWLMVVFLVWGVLLLIYGVDADGWGAFGLLVAGSLLIGFAVGLIRRPAA